MVRFPDKGLRKDPSKFFDAVADVDIAQLRVKACHNIWNILREGTIFQLSLAQFLLGALALHHLIL